MAVDTRDKRSSAIHLMWPWRNQLPTPSGAIPVGLRQEIALLYSGISSGPAPTVTDVYSFPFIANVGTMMCR
jgi:hypothetical protein